MSKLEANKFGEEIKEVTLDSGLKLIMINKPKFQKVQADIIVNFGSNNNKYLVDGKEFNITDGVAHFLEHKMFETPTGDIFLEFAKYGANANANTSFDRTIYLFNTTKNYLESLETLFDLVSNLYIDDKSVQKEKPIIEQELRMYDNNPDWRLFFGGLQAMYHNHPIKIDIGGTKESIYQITTEELKKVWELFYSHQNMALVIAGPIDFAKVEAIAHKKSNSKKLDVVIEEQIAKEPEAVFSKQKTIKMNVTVNKNVLALKFKPLVGMAGEKKSLAVEFICDLLFSRINDNYLNAEKEGIINDTFDVDIIDQKGVLSAFFSCELDDSTTYFQYLKERLLNIDSLDKEKLRGLKNKKKGEFIDSFTTPNQAVGVLEQFVFNEINYFDLYDLIEEIDIAYLKEVAQEIKEDHFSEVVVSK